MALLIHNEDGTYETKCPLCAEPLSDPIFATSHFIGDQSDPLWMYSDAGMHWDCYANWKDQPRFANQYFEVEEKYAYRNSYWPTVLALPNLLVSANVDLNPPEARLVLRSIGPGPRLNLDEWEDWLAGGYRLGHSHALQRDALAEVLDDLRAHLPTLRAIKVAAQAAKKAM